MSNSDLILLGKNILFSPKKNTLISKVDSSQVVPLENLEAKVLLKLYQAQGETLSKDVLFECWPPEVNTSDNSLTRIISTLRKKSKSIDPTLESFIVNISKKGYHLKIEHSEKQALIPIENEGKKDKEDKEDKEITLANNKPFSSSIRLSIFFIATVIVVSLILAILFSAESTSESDDRLQTKKPHYKIAYESKTMKHELSPSESGDFIVFSAQVLDSPQRIIAIHTVANSTTEYIKRPGVELTSPILLPDDNVVFKNIKDDQCWIEKINLSALLAGDIGETIASCSANSPTFSMAYNGNNGLFITESYKESIPANLRLINIENGEQVVIKAGQKGGTGIYKVVTNKDNTLVALLSCNDWFTTHIAIFESDNFDKPLWSTQLESLLYSAALFDSKVIYKDNYGGITTVNFDDDGKQLDSSQLPIMQPFKAVTRFNKGIIFNEGEFYSQNIFINGLYADTSTAITDEKGIKNNIPFQFDDEQVWYSSNRTGISQIWSYNQNTQQQKQVSSFNKSLLIKSMSVDKDNSIAAISTQSGILIFNLDSQYHFNELIAQVEGTHPALADDKLIFTGKKSGNYNIFSYQLNSGEIKQITANGGYNPLVIDDKLFFENYHKFGIWTLSEKGQEELLIPLSFELAHWFYFEDSFYLYDNANQLYTYDTVTDELSENELSADCNKAKYIVEGFCIKVNNEKFANQMVILDGQE